MIRLGVTGTDTGVGKTMVTCAIAAALVRRGVTVAAMKPIETGCEFGDPHRDGARLHRASNESRGLDVVAPLTFPEPVAPMLAAELAKEPIDLGALGAAVERAADGRDVLLVEGAGGLLVPVASGVAFDTLFRAWSLDVLIVAANRLGVINHTRLTVAAARAAGLRVAGIVLKQVGQDGSDRSVRDNLRIIRDIEQLPVVELPRLPAVDDLDSAAALAEQSGLMAMVMTPAAATTSD